MMIRRLPTKIISKDNQQQMVSIPGFGAIAISKHYYHDTKYTCLGSWGDVNVTGTYYSASEMILVDIQVTDIKTARKQFAVLVAAMEMDHRNVR